MGYSSWGSKVSNTMERLTFTLCLNSGILDFSVAGISVLLSKEIDNKETMEVMSLRVN